MASTSTSTTAEKASTKGTPNTVEGGLDPETAEQIRVWTDPRRRVAETRKVDTAEEPAPHYKVGTALVESYVQARLSDPRWMVSDEHVHPELTACVRAILERLCGPRLYEELRDGSFMQVKESEPMGKASKRRLHLGSTFNVKDPNTFKRYALYYAHRVLLRLNPAPGTRPTLMPTPKPGTISIVELPESEEETTRRLQQLGLIRATEAEDGEIL